MGSLVGASALDVWKAGMRGEGEVGVPSSRAILTSRARALARVALRRFAGVGEAPYARSLSHLTLRQTLRVQGELAFAGEVAGSLAPR